MKWLILQPKFIIIINKWQEKKGNQKEILKSNIEKILQSNIKNYEEKIFFYLLSIQMTKVYSNDN